jgi:hypothetical protein
MYGGGGYPGSLHPEKTSLKGYRNPSHPGLIGSGTDTATMARSVRKTVLLVLATSALAVVVVGGLRWWNERYALYRILSSDFKQEALDRVKLLRSGRYLRAMPCLVVALAEGVSPTYVRRAFGAAMSACEREFTYARFEKVFWRDLFKPHVADEEMLDHVMQMLREDEEVRRLIESIRNDPGYAEVIRRSLAAALSTPVGQTWSCTGCVDPE